jgi:hypothetical protein
MSPGVRTLIFAALALAIHVADGFLYRHVNPARQTAVAMAATADVVLVVSAIYYWLLVRPGIRSRSSVAVIALAGGLHAASFYPGGEVFRQVAAGVCEIGLIGWVVSKLRGLRDGDPLEAIERAIPGQLFAPAVAKLLVGEIAILYYALFSWRKRPHVPEGARAFGLDKSTGFADLLMVVAFASVFEIVPVHLLLHRWSAVAAWIATAVSVYGAIWLVGLARSIALRPAWVSDEIFEVRYGLLFRARIPVAQIASVERSGGTTATEPFTNVPRRGEPNLFLTFAEPVDAESLFGFRKRVSRIALAADDPNELAEALSYLVRLPMQ